MKKILMILFEITLETICSFTYFIKNNLINFANILNLLVPYLMYFIGQYVALGRHDVGVGVEIFTPLIFLIIIFYLKSTANKLGKGITIPIPDRRFTKVDDDGEVSIRHDRIQELLLYTADLEDWMERKGIL